MLLQEIVSQLDGELARLKSLRGIVADLGRGPELFPPQGTELPELSQSLPDADEPEPTVESTLEPSAEELRVAVVRSGSRGRPRREKAVSGLHEDSETRPRRNRRPVEPSALSRAASSGPVVISAAALAREREARQTVRIAPAAAKGTAPMQAEPTPQPMPEVDARALAARWLNPSNKR